MAFAERGGFSFQINSTKKAYFFGSPWLRSSYLRQQYPREERPMLRLQEIRTIYEQGVEAVAATIKHLYQMIEIEDERVYELVASATAANLRKIEQLTACVAKLEENLSNKVRQIH